MNDDNPRGVRENMERFITKYGSSCVEPDWESLNIAYGRSSVLVYADWRASDVTLDPYLFSFTVDDNVYQIWSLRFVRIKGKWVVWDFD